MVSSERDTRSKFIIKFMIRLVYLLGFLSLARSKETIFPRRAASTAGGDTEQGPLSFKVENKPGRPRKNWKPSDTSACEGTRL